MNKNDKKNAFLKRVIKLQCYKKKQQQKTHIWAGRELKQPQTF